MEDITGIEIISIHSDVSTRTGEKVIIISLNKTLEK
ncbi:MAG: Na-translocating system protein MpsC family protein [Bacillota bacterium]